MRMCSNGLLLLSAAWLDDSKLMPANKRPSAAACIPHDVSQLLKLRMRRNSCCCA
jgi:hypothetical protein